MSKNYIFVLIDCNNFYVSCERIFQPKLNNSPVLVLSNNDGCIIARSNEVKDLGINMGDPIFKYKALIEKHNIKIFSGNLTLYGDISKRVMQIIENNWPDIEIYSIDEAFIKVNEESDVAKLCINIQNQIKKYLSIPVSIGVGKTKTQAKLANLIAKSYKKNNIFDIRRKDLQDRVMSKLDVDKIWGISKAMKERLAKLYIFKISHLRDANRDVIRKKCSITGLRIRDELNDISCLDLNKVEDKKSIRFSRSFGKIITEKKDIEQAVANYAFLAAEKLRKQRSKVSNIYVFLRTNKFNIKDKQYNNNITLSFNYPTNETSKIISLAKIAVNEIYKKGYNYKKTGIILLNLVSEDYNQINIFNNNNSNKIDTMIDEINNKMGKKVIFYASQGVKKDWKMRSDNKSLDYTTNINHILEVN